MNDELVTDVFRQGILIVLMQIDIISLITYNFEFIYNKYIVLQLGHDSYLYYNVHHLFLGNVFNNKEIYCTVACSNSCVRRRDFL